MAENDTITGLSGSEEADLAKMRKDMLAGQDLIPNGADKTPVHAPGLSEEVPHQPEPEPEPTPQPAPAEQPQPQQGQVPVAAVAEERERRRELQRQLDEQRQFNEKAQDRLTQLMTAMEHGQRERLDQAKQQAVPDFAEDPEGHLKWMQETYQKDRAADQQKLQQMEQQLGYQQQVEQVKQRAAAQAQSFAAQQPDFMQAYQHVRNQELQALVAQGYSADVASQIAEKRELDFMYDAEQTGQNAAELMYKTALVRGYQPAQAQPSPQPQPSYNQTPQQPAPQPQGQPTLQNMQAGMLESQSLQHAAGGGEGMPLDLEAFANMSEAEFARNLDNIRTAMARAGMRGR